MNAMIWTLFRISGNQLIEILNDLNGRIVFSALPSMVAIPVALHALLCGLIKGEIAAQKLSEGRRAQPIKAVSNSAVDFNHVFANQLYNERRNP